MKWFFLLGNSGFALACLVLSITHTETAGMTLPVGAMSAVMAFVVWSDCRAEWRP